MNQTRLYRYTPVRPDSERLPVPLLLVYALINKPYIFDFIPGRSFVAYLLRRGFDVYQLDWGAPGPADHTIRFDDYVSEYLRRAIRALLRITDKAAFSMLGYCLGGTLATIYAALYPEAPLRNLILLTAPLDFSQPADGYMTMWLDSHVLDVDRLVDTLGNIPGGLIKHWARWLRPVENFVGAYVHLWKSLDDPQAVQAWQVLNRWVEDSVPFAGEAFRQFAKQYVQENQLSRGIHTIQGQRVALSNIHAALLNVSAQYDHLVARHQSEGIMPLVSSSDKTFHSAPLSHVGVMTSQQAARDLWPLIADWLAQRSEQ